MTDERETGQAAQIILRAAAPQRPVPQTLPLGAHLVTRRRAYSHHGIYVGDGRVVHYEGLSLGIHRGPVKEVSIDEFADGHEVTIRAHPGARYFGEQVAARARSRLGEDRYRLITNNCEHFCEWCINGLSRSEQVERLAALPHGAARLARALFKRPAGARFAGRSFGSSLA